MKVDLKDAYFAVPMDQEHRKYQCFALGERMFQFTCLPFGLTLAPWVFTKTLKPVIALGRELGLRLVIYIDDILLMAELKERAQEQGEALVYLLECLGFTINREKKVSQTAKFLGFNVNTRTMEMNLPTLKLKTIRAESRKLLREGHISARALSRLTGRMNAADQVIPPGPLFYRHLQMDLSEALRRSGQNYDTLPYLSEDSKEELRWWDTDMSRWNGKTIQTRHTDLTIQSDASTTGRGATCQGTDTGGPW